MFQFFANIFGYLLNIINDFVGNYGLAIILFKYYSSVYFVNFNFLYG